jgi:thiosulfate dehydrogenase
MENNLPQDRIIIRLISLLTSLMLSAVVLLVGAIGLVIYAIKNPNMASQLTSENTKPSSVPAVASRPARWQAPDVSAIPAGPDGELIRYGRELIAHTSEYLGPEGKVQPISNGMNCQNCHLEAGTKPFGNNYSAVASTYPKFRARSGTLESIEKRVNDCFERSLNGKPLDSLSREMRAIVSYIKWLGKEVPKGSTPAGAGLVELALLDRPASPENGNLVYEQKCSLCHGANGEGIRHPDGIGWIYPPLWGADSYNTGAGLYRLSRFAGYIKANMPLGATVDEPQLTDEEAWDVAAYVNSLPRPGKDISADWPDLTTKPVDHPFGPFHDGFSEAEHKYGPYKPILEKRKLLTKATH